MKARPTITAIELIQFGFELQDVGREPTIGIPIYKPGSTLQSGGNAIKIHTDIGVTGEFVGGAPTDYAAIRGFAPSLIGRQALERDKIYNDVKQATRQIARMGRAWWTSLCGTLRASSTTPRFTSCWAGINRN